MQRIVLIALLSAVLLSTAQALRQESLQPSQVWVHSRDCALHCDLACMCANPARGDCDMNCLDCLMQGHDCGMARPAAPSFASAPARAAAAAAPPLQHAPAARADFNKLTARFAEIRAEPDAKPAAAEVSQTPAAEAAFDVEPVVKAESAVAAASATGGAAPAASAPAASASGTHVAEVKPAEAEVAPASSATGAGSGGSTRNIIAAAPQVVGNTVIMTPQRGQVTIGGGNPPGSAASGGGNEDASSLVGRLRRIDRLEGEITGYLHKIHAQHRRLHALAAKQQQQQQQQQNQMRRRRQQRRRAHLDSSDDQDRDDVPVYSLDGDDDDEDGLGGRALRSSLRHGLHLIKLVRVHGGGLAAVVAEDDGDWDRERSGSGTSRRRRRADNGGAGGYQGSDESDDDDSRQQLDASIESLLSHLEDLIVFAKRTESASEQGVLSEQERASAARKVDRVIEFVRSALRASRRSPARHREGSADDANGSNDATDDLAALEAGAGALMREAGSLGEAPAAAATAAKPASAAKPQAAAAAAVMAEQSSRAAPAAKPSQPQAQAQAQAQQPQQQRQRHPEELAHPPPPMAAGPPADDAAEDAADFLPVAGTEDWIPGAMN